MRALLSHRMIQTKRVGLWAALFVVMMLCSGALTAHSFASGAADASGKRLLTIHDRGNELGIVTSASTLRQALKENDIAIADNDLVEPGLDDKLVAEAYQVNIYRARPVLVVDGTVARKVLSPYQTAAQIARDAGVELHDEDLTKVEPIRDIATNGPGLQVTIDRATPFTLVLYGKKTQAYTREATVAEMLQRKSIKLASDDTISVTPSDRMSAGMTIEIWRNGTQTVTVDEDIDFATEQIKDADQKVGYRQVKTPGVKGKATVTYEIVMKNGVEVSRAKIQSVTTKEPTSQVEVVGSKPSFDGDFAAALAKLRSCEGGYNSWNAAGPYYGAYQFNRGTWGSVADPAKYGSATPAEQDEAARQLYLRRGWQPWPHCGAGLPDIYR